MSGRNFELALVLLPVLVPVLVLRLALAFRLARRCGLKDRLVLTVRFKTGLRFAHRLAIELASVIATAPAIVIVTVRVILNASGIWSVSVSGLGIGIVSRLETVTVITRGQVL